MCGEFGLVNNFFGVRTHIVMFSTFVITERGLFIQIIAVFENEEEELRGLFLYLTEKTLPVHEKKIVGHPISCKNGPADEYNFAT